MKAYKNSIIFLVVFAVLLGGYFAYEKFGKKADDAGSGTTAANDSNYQTILKAEKDKIIEIKIQYKGQNLVFGPKDKKIVLTSPANVKFNETTIYNMTSTLESVVSSKIIENNPKDLAQYGLNNPKATITVKLTDGSAKTLYVGNKSPSDSNYYVKISGSDVVYTVGSYSVEALLIDADKIRDKSLFVFEKPEDINYLALEKNGKLSFEAKVEGDSGWLLKQPIQYEADSSRLQPILDAALKLSIKEFVAENAANLSEFGLDSPPYSVAIGARDAKTVKLLIGKEKLRGKEVYARLDGSQDVFILDESNFNFGDKTAIDVMSRFVYIVNINDVNKMEITGNGETSTFIIDTGKKDDTDDDKFYAGDVKVKNDKDFRTFYQAVIGLLADEVKLDEKPSGTPEVTTIYYQKKDPAQVKVEYIPRDAYTYHVVKNGQYTGLVIKKDQIKDMFTAIKTLKDIVKGQK